MRDNPSVGGRIETTIKTISQAKRLFCLRAVTVIIFNLMSPVIIKGNSNKIPKSDEVINISDKYELILQIFCIPRLSLITAKNLKAENKIEAPKIKPKTKSKIQTGTDASNILFSFLFNPGKIK